MRDADKGTPRGTAPPSSETPRGDLRALCRCTGRALLAIWVNPFVNIVSSPNRGPSPPPPFNHAPVNLTLGGGPDGSLPRRSPWAEMAGPPDVTSEPLARRSSRVGGLSPGHRKSTSCLGPLWKVGLPRWACRCPQGLHRAPEWGRTAGKSWFENSGDHGTGDQVANPPHSQGSPAHGAWDLPTVPLLTAGPGLEPRAMRTAVGARSSQ